MRAAAYVASVYLPKGQTSLLLKITFNLKYLPWEKQKN